MAEQCKFPGCRFSSESNGYCIRHKIYSGTTTPKVVYQIPKKSAKMKNDDKILAAMKKLETSNDCELKSPVCTGKMQGYDHQQKTSPKNRTDRKNLKRACNACNSYKEKNPAWAKENGFHVSRFKK